LVAASITISLLFVESAEVVIGFVLLVVPLLADAPMEVVWSTFERNTLAYETELVVALQVGTNVPLVAAATPDSLRINAAT
jgi:hypothetical protein